MQKTTRNKALSSVLTSEEEPAENVKVGSVLCESICKWESLLSIEKEGKMTAKKNQLDFRKASKNLGN